MSHEAWLKTPEYRREKIYKRASELELQIPKLRYSDFKKLLREIKKIGVS